VLSIEEINALPPAEFVAALGGIFEHSPWVATGSLAARPFAGVEALHGAMVATVKRANRDDQVQLLRAHPELAGRAARAGTLTRDSTSEQGRLGFDALMRTDLERVARVNRAYREKFGFPCIVALRLHASRDTVIAEMERRLANDGDAELANGLDQVFHIARGRLDKLLDAQPRTG